MPEGVRLQNLRDFTVQIRNANEQIVGTGIAVSMDGKVVTCRHVIEAAIKSPAIDGAEVGVYFPQARGGEQKQRQARVEKYFSQYDDDVVLLQLTGGASPLAPEQIAVLGTAEYSEDNPFRTYGYSPIGNYPAARGDGTILGIIEPPLNKDLQADPIQLKSRDIAAGMSGAAVLDVNRNLVIGLVAERFYSPSLVQDDIGYGIDLKVLTLAPFDFELRDESLELKPAPEFRLDKEWFERAIEVAGYAFRHRLASGKYSWNNAPAVLIEWTGREELLKQIDTDWSDLQKKVTGLIGFGGEGKSSLARKWVDEIIGKGGRASALTPDGVFWWGFYENRSIDEFLEAALNYLGGGRIDPRQVPSSSTRAQIIGAMLGAGRYLFVLDGLEVLQHQDGDQYGLLQSNDLRDLLTYFARPDNQSFCLVTSRAPLLDLMDYTTYSHHDVDRLSEQDGVALLEKLGVHPAPETGSGARRDNGQLAKVVADWDGHALTLSILAAILVEKHGGDVAHIDDLPKPVEGEPRYERVHRVLRRYDEHLNETEREFLKLFSAFRTPVNEDAFEKVFVPLLAKNVGATGQSPLPEMVKRLVTYRILKHDPASQTYTAHPLVRNHYLALLTKGENKAQEQDAHLKIKDYYLSLAGDTPTYPTLEDLKPLIEVVHHACKARAYDDANKIRRERIYQGDRFILLHQLGAYETALSIFIEFFPNSDLNQEPLVSEASDKQVILANIALCLMSLGRLRESVPFYERAAKGYLERQVWHNASAIYQNLADLYAALGALEASAEAARQALNLARRAENKQDECLSLARQARPESLQGNMSLADDLFQQAEKLAESVASSRYLWSDLGIFHADHLRRTGVSTGSTQAADYARRVTEANLQIVDQYHVVKDISMCHRVLGDLDSDPSTGSGQAAGNYASARAHYETALKLARGISRRDVLIEALLARGRFYAKVGAGLSDGKDAHRIMADPPLLVTEAFNDLNDPSTSSPVPAAPAQAGQAPLSQAFSDLQEALTYALEGGYRIYEADLRVALAWAWLATSTTLSASLTPGPSPESGRGRQARAEATRALEMSQEMGYYWGKVDAQEVLARLAS